MSVNLTTFVRYYPTRAKAEAAYDGWLADMVDHRERWGGLWICTRDRPFDPAKAPRYDVSIAHLAWDDGVQRTCVCCGETWASTRRAQREREARGKAP